MGSILARHRIEISENSLQAVNRIGTAVDNIANVVQGGVGFNAQNLEAADRMVAQWGRSMTVLEDIRQRGLLQPEDVAAVRTMFHEMRACSAQASLDARVLSTHVGADAQQVIQRASLLHLQLIDFQT
jgi:hypothetical protein